MLPGSISLFFVSTELFGCHVDRTSGSDAKPIDRRMEFSGPRVFAPLSSLCLFPTLIVLNRLISRVL